VVIFPDGSGRCLSEKPKVDPQRAREMAERTRERSLIVQALKNRGALTVGELSKATGLEKPKVVRHLVALRQFGKALIVGERDDEFVYDLPEEK
jgi:DNA-binding transcriptional ArsR family regulator